MENELLHQWFSSGYDKFCVKTDFGCFQKDEVSQVQVFANGETLIFLEGGGMAYVNGPILVIANQRKPKKEGMQISEALEILYDLASENTLDGKDADTDELQAMRSRQKEALDIVHDLVMNHEEKLDTMFTYTYLKD